jgi:Na+-transporting methylmalonyl-CoA/oxaloacetate decarboxylase gamma subunit
MALAVIWHYWIGVVFFVLSLLVVVGVIVGYLVRVQALKYPKR